MEVRKRFRKIVSVAKADLTPHPLNWRMHPDKQKAAMRGILAEVGNVAPIIARRLADGKWQIIDGHLREETLPGEKVDVLEVDLTDEETALVLASFDAIGDLAEQNDENLAALLEEVTIQSEALDAMFQEMLAESDAEELDEEATPAAAEPAEVNVEEVFQVIVECKDEDDQRKVFETMREKGYRCRALTL